MEVPHRNAQARRVLLGILTLGGNGLILNSLLHLFSLSAGPKFILFLFIMVLFAGTSRLSIPLPSGANWRPGLLLLMPAMFVLPTWQVPLVGIPGLILLAPKGQWKWTRYPRTFAHVALGLSAGSLVFHLGLTLRLFESHHVLGHTMTAAGLALLTHLVVNRVLSALIVATRQQRSFTLQLRLVAGELHWGYFASYMVILSTFVVSMTHLWWALVLNASIQLGLYKMMSYYQMLQESEQRYRSLKEHHPDGICSLDLRGNFVTQNPAFRKLLGYSDGVLFGKNIVDLIDRTDATAEGACRVLLSGDVDGEVLLSLRHYEGMTVEVNCTSVPIVVEGRRAGLYLIVKDVALQRRAEELVVQTEKMTIVGQLAAGVAHEIRNPLTSLKGFVQLMRSSGVPEAQQRYLNIMEDELDRIEVVAGEFLMLARPHAVHIARVDLRTTVRDVAALLTTLATMRGIQIQTEYCGDVPPLECDENQLKQVLINVAKNGIEAMDAGTLTIRLSSNQTCVWIEVEDEGVGIPEDALPKLGSPFYTTKPQGTGLGLTVSQKIIASYNGDMQIQSRAGRGTTVTISLPAPVSDNLPVLADV